MVNAQAPKVVVFNGLKKTSLNAPKKENAVLLFQEVLANFVFNGTVPDQDVIALNGQPSQEIHATKLSRDALKSNHSEEVFASRKLPNVPNGSREPELFKRRFAKPRFPLA